MAYRVLGGLLVLLWTGSAGAETPKVALVVDGGAVLRVSFGDTVALGTTMFVFRAREPRLRLASQCRHLEPKVMSRAANPFT